MTSDPGPPGWSDAAATPKNLILRILCNNAADQMSVAPGLPCRRPYCRNYRTDQ